MMVLLIVVLVLVVGGVVAVVTGRLGADAMSTATETSAFELPDGPLVAQGADVVRFDQSLRGYNMGQVDAVLDRLFDEIETLRGRLDGAAESVTLPDSRGHEASAAASSSGPSAGLDSTVLGSRGTVSLTADSLTTDSDEESLPPIPAAPWKTVEAADGATADNATSERVLTSDDSTAHDGRIARRARHGAADDDRS